MLMRKALLLGGLMAGSIVAAPRALPGVQSPHDAATPPAAGLDPVLVQVPARVEIEGARPAMVTVQGDHFKPGLTLTLDSAFHVFTFGALSIEGLTPTSLRFDAATLTDGAYQVSVRNPNGHRSRALPLVVKLK